MNDKVSIVIWNDRTRPHVVWIEPWGGDVTLLPKQRLTISTTGPNSTNPATFTLTEDEYNTQVYVETFSFPELLLEGTPVKEGHNRQAAIDAGVYIDSDNYMGR
ncbi:MAG: hypothetical protein DWH81_03910 [Planctomycetota bacterium]|nr:MAG: hypothetical protein DWH81_03910 [Planctomycetota bacterium]